MAGLLVAEQIAGAADLKILQGDAHARSEISVLGNGREPLMGSLGERPLGVVEEIGVRPLAATADPPAQLVQLAQTEVIGPVDDERVRVGDVDARFDDSRADEHVDLLVPEVDDHLLKRTLAHLPVGDRDSRLRHEIAQPRCDPVDRLDPVVNEEHLAVSEQLAADRSRDLLIVIGADEGEHRVALLRWGLDDRHLANPGHRHLQGARDWGSRHCEDIDIRAESLEVLLVLDAEPLLLIEDDQAEILEPNPRGDESVGADDDINRSVCETREHLLRLLFTAEPRQGGQTDRKGSKALGEG